MWISTDAAKIRRVFPTLAEAKAWRADAQVQLRKGLLRASAPVTVREAADAWLAGTRSGAIRNRSGDPYKPSTIRGYEEALRLRVLDDLGGVRLDALHRAVLQELVDSLLIEGHSPSTIRNTILPLRAIFRRALARGEVGINPTRGLELPAVRGRRNRIASPKEASALLAALSSDRVIWATALYAGLRRGELRALDLDDIDLASNVIRIRRSWDAKEGLIAPKSRAGTRVIPIPSALKTVLAEHRLALGRSSGLAFGSAEDVPFQPRTVTNRAGRAWKKANLKPITLHECRHTLASLMIAAGVNAKALSTYMGHSSVVITFDWHHVGRALIAQGVPITSTLGASVELKEFGRRAIIANGAEVRPRITKAYEVLAYLVSDGRGRAKRAELLDALFGERADHAARSYLSQALAALRDVLPAGSLVVEPTAVRFADQLTVTSESVRLEGRLVEAARLEGEAGLVARLDALAIHDQGEYLPGRRSSWADERARELADVVADARLAAAELAFEAGRLEEAQRLNAPVLAHDPTREAAWRLAMRVANSLGDNDGVLAAYQACTRALGAIGLTPAPSTRQMVEYLRR